MENNPYAAPSAVVDDVPAFSSNDLEARKATRGQRLGATMLDGLIVAICIVPVFVATAYFRNASGAGRPNVAGGIFILIGVVLLLAMGIYNIVLLKRNGQTIGKRTLNIKIVRNDGSPVALSRIIFLRWLPVTLLGVIPFIARFVNLIDAVVIFRNDRRCLHDYIADTIVIND